MANCKLILSDFDGTLLRSDGTVAAETVEDIKRYVKSGGRFAVCTGRMLASILQYADELGLTGDIAGGQGAVIYNLDKKEFLRRGGIDAKDGARIAKNIEDKYKRIHLYIDDKLYVSFHDELTVIYEKMCRVKATLLDCKPSEYIKKHGSVCEKIMIFNTEEENGGCYDDLSKKYGEEFFVSTSSQYFVEISDRRYTKGAALEFLAQRYNIDIKDTLAVGDNLNDLTMLKAAGRGIAVANASEGLKAAVGGAFEYSCDQNAVGKIIRKYGLGEEIFD